MHRHLIDFFRLIRWVNLLYIALTQCLIRFCLIGPIYSNGFIAIDFSLSNFHFALLVLSTVLIAGSGYIINDYFDVKADEINKPHRIIIDRTISRRNAILWHLAFNFTGIALGFYLASKVGYWQLGFIHVISMVFLWLYSTWLKKTVLFGNILVSLLTAFVVMTVIYYEQSLWLELQPRMPEIFGYIYKFGLGYAGFAFLTNFIREVIKDMEDIKGDLQDKCRTLPIVFGIRTAKNVAILLILIMFCLLCMYEYTIALDFKESQGLAFYQVKSIRLIFTFIQLPLVYLILLLMKADKASDFKKISTIFKLIMMVGILYLVFLAFSVG